MTTENLLTATGLIKRYPIGGGLLGGAGLWVRAVNGVDLQIRQGENFGLVGESGCGKSTLGRLILRLEEPDEGRIIFDGQDVLSLKPKDLKRLRRDFQIIFQDPFSSLNPRKTVGRIVGEALAVHGLLTRVERRRRVAELMHEVGLRPEHANRYPHEFSGGQRQRLAVARALVLNPKLIVADEPVSALDVSIQAQILNLLVDLQSRFRLTYLFISHDLAVMRHFCDRVAVMYLGRIVELADRETLFSQPFHPYTQTLLSAAPVDNPNQRRHRLPLKGEVPSQINPPEGCSFHPRCLQADLTCAKERPDIKEIETNHWTACWRL